MLEKVLTIPGDTDVPGFTKDTWLAKSGDRFVAGPLDVPGLIAAFDSAGGRSWVFGSAGDGPGEFRWIGRIAQAGGDSVVVPDRRLRRLSVLDRNGVLGRMIPLAGGPEKALLDSQLVVTYTFRGRGVAHVLEMTADGLSGIPLPVGDPDDLPPPVTALHGGSVVVVPRLHYSLYIFDRRGSLSAMQVQERPWMAQPESNSTLRAEAPGWGFISDIVIDPVNHLWVLATVKC